MTERTSGRIVHGRVGPDGGITRRSGQRADGGGSAG